MASRGDIEERLRPLIDGVEDFIAKPFLVKDLVRITKKVLDRISSGKMQKRASRPGVYSRAAGEEMSMTDLLQVARNGQKFLPAGGSPRWRAGRTFFGRASVAMRKSRYRR